MSDNKGASSFNTGFRSYIHSTTVDYLAKRINLEAYLFKLNKFLGDRYKELGIKTNSEMSNYKGFLKNFSSVIDGINNYQNICSYLLNPLIISEKSRFSEDLSCLLLEKLHIVNDYEQKKKKNGLERSNMNALLFQELHEALATGCNRDLALGALDDYFGELRTKLEPHRELTIPAISKLESMVDVLGLPKDMLGKDNIIWYLTDGDSLIKNGNGESDVGTLLPIIRSGGTGVWKCIPEYTAINQSD